MRSSKVGHPPGRPRSRNRLIFPLLFAVLAACSQLPFLEAETPTAPPEPTATPLPTGIPPISELGTSRNPLILALPPSAQITGEVEKAGKTLVALLEKNTRYQVVSVLPPSEGELVQGFSNGNAHIGVLSPFAYLLASSEGSVEAVFAREQSNATFYGAQFIAHSSAGFKSYFDPLQELNLAEAPIALQQFQYKKPCWADPRSPSGYVVPLGFLKQSHIVTLQPAFLAGHASVVRALDAGGICDFGATYIDARTYPGLEDQYPDLLKKVQVIWRIPAIIPYETLVFARDMNEDMRRNLTRAFVDIAGTADGRSAMQILYGFQSMQVAQDGQYDAFRKAVKASDLDLTELVK